jgi:puromycin-sensitive aminopeptidase
MYDQESSSTLEVAADFRLPAGVRPEVYDLRIEPDLEAARFSGEVTVVLRIDAATDEIRLHALELDLNGVWIERDGVRLDGSIQMVPQLEQAVLRFNRKLEAGQWSLHIGFKGILNDKLHGFYRSTYWDANGSVHIVAATQFEATDARRAFPCWDEPALKARFRATLIVKEGLTAISNGGVVSERTLGNGKKEVVFRETIPMSTYLVAFVVGEFDATDPVDAGTPLRVVHVPGKAGLTQWARQIGVFSLRFFADYYGLPYPGDKLDLIAIPDFASGAMENLGAITFRETALLVDANSASRAELERVADVVAHENAHMWFGDLVTMKWWNGIWLNEAFATFMEMLAVDQWKPGWKRWESFAASRTAAMAIDGLAATRPIEYPVRTPEDARAMFDVLTYEKGAAVLRMLEQYLGSEVFRRGIALYLRRYRFGNTETGDLWDALEEASAEPVRKLMDSWIFQPGFPILEVERSPQGPGVRISQRRFFYLPPEQASQQQSWDVPVMARAQYGSTVETRKILMTGKEASLALPQTPEWILLNEGGHGFYRVAYSSDLLAGLAARLEALKPVERYGLVSDTWAVTVAGLKPVDEFLSFINLFRQEDDLNVWRALTSPMHYLAMIIDEKDRPGLAALVVNLAGAAFERMGWMPAESDDELRRQLRGMLASLLGSLGEDERIIRRAEELYGLYRQHPEIVDRDVVPALITILAHRGDRARYDEFKRYFKSARTPQEEQRYLFALAGFSDLALLEETMAMTLNGEIRTQNAPYVLHSLLLNPVCRYQAWEFLKQHWDEICEKFPDSALPRMCDGIVSLLDREAEVRNFFATHRVRLGGKLIDQHLERLAVAVAFRAREGARLHAVLTRACTAS